MTSTSNSPLLGLAHVALVALRAAIHGPKPTLAEVAYDALQFLVSTFGPNLALAGDRALDLLLASDPWEDEKVPLDVRIVANDMDEVRGTIVAALCVHPRTVTVSPLKRGSAPGSRLHQRLTGLSPSSNLLRPNVDIIVELVPTLENAALVMPVLPPDLSLSQPMHMQVASPEVLVAEATERLVREFRRDRQDATGEARKYIQPHHVAPIARIVPLLTPNPFRQPLNQYHLVLALHRVFERRGTAMPKRLPPMRPPTCYQGLLDQMRYRQLVRASGHDTKSSPSALGSPATGLSMSATYSALQRIIDPALARLEMLCRAGRKLRQSPGSSGSSILPMDAP